MTDNVRCRDCAYCSCINFNVLYKHYHNICKHYSGAKDTDKLRTCKTFEAKVKKGCNSCRHSFKVNNYENCPLINQCSNEGEDPWEARTCWNCENIGDVVFYSRGGTKCYKCFYTEGLLQKGYVNKNCNHFRNRPDVLEVKEVESIVNCSTCFGYTIDGDCIWNDTVEICKQKDGWRDKSHKGGLCRYCYKKSECGDSQTIECNKFIHKSIIKETRVSCSGCRWLSLERRKSKIYPYDINNEYECKHGETPGSRCYAYEKWVWDKIYTPRVVKKDVGYAYCDIENMICKHKYSENINPLGSCTIKSKYERATCRFKVKDKTTTDDPFYPCGAEKHPATLGKTLSAVRGAPDIKPWIHSPNIIGNHVEPSWIRVRWNTDTDLKPGVVIEKTEEQKLVDESIKLKEECMKEEYEQYKQQLDMLKNHTTLLNPITIEKNDGLDAMGMIYDEFKKRKEKKERIEEALKFPHEQKEVSEVDDLRELDYNEIERKYNDMIEKKRIKNKDLAEKIRYDIFEQKGIKKDFLKYLKKQTIIRGSNSFHDFSKKDCKSLKSFKRSMWNGEFRAKEKRRYYNIEDITYKNNYLDLLEKLLLYKDSYLKEKAIEKLCKIAPNCQEVLEYMRQQNQRGKFCPECKCKIRKKAVFCSACGHRVGGVAEQ